MDLTDSLLPESIVSEYSSIFGWADSLLEQNDWMENGDVRDVLPLDGSDREEFALDDIEDMTKWKGQPWKDESSRCTCKNVPEVCLCNVHPMISPLRSNPFMGRSILDDLSDDNSLYSRNAHSRKRHASPHVDTPAKKRIAEVNPLTDHSNYCRGGISSPPCPATPERVEELPWSPSFQKEGQSSSLFEDAVSCSDCNESRTGQKCSKCAGNRTSYLQTHLDINSVFGHLAQHKSNQQSSSLLCAAISNKHKLSQQQQQQKQQHPQHKPPSCNPNSILGRSAHSNNMPPPQQPATPPTKHTPHTHNPSVSHHQQQHQHPHISNKAIFPLLSQQYATTSHKAHSGRRRTGGVGAAAAARQAVQAKKAPPSRARGGQSGRMGQNAGGRGKGKGKGKGRMMLVQALSDHDLEKKNELRKLKADKEKKRRDKSKAQLDEVRAYLEKEFKHDAPSKKSQQKIVDYMTDMVATLFRMNNQHALALVRNR